MDQKGGLQPGSSSTDDEQIRVIPETQPEHLPSNKDGGQEASFKNLLIY